MDPTPTPPLSTTYRDHVIYYHIEENEWRCDAFTNNRGSPSLLLAQARVDKIVDPPADKPRFEKQTAWKKSFNWKDGWQKVTITSKTEDGCWITKGKEREKVGRRSMDNLFADTPENATLIEEIKRLDAERDTLSERIRATTEKLTPVVL